MKQQRSCLVALGVAIAFASVADENNNQERKDSPPSGIQVEVADGAVNESATKAQTTTSKTTVEKEPLPEIDLKTKADPRSNVSLPQDI